MTVHHVRESGSPKNDRRIVGLCAAGHLHDFGQHCIERLGKRKFQEYWDVDLEAEIRRMNELWKLSGLEDTKTLKGK